MANQLGQRTNGDNINTLYQGSFLGITGRNYHCGKPILFGKSNHRKYAMRMTHAAIERKLPQEKNPRNISSHLL
jgi:hypothetical protein